MHTRDDVVDFGGDGQPIILLHGLMGRARTWGSVSGWLRAYGRVLAPDAAGHGRGPHCGPWRTERFVADLAELVTELAAGPVVVIGHSMGGLHALGLAANYPELVRAVVVEDMAPDQRGKTVEMWRAYFESWPVPFQSLAEVRAFFGSAGDYFIECFDERDDGYHLTADLENLYAIATEWGEREYWSFVDNMRCPLLVLEAETSMMPAGQQAEMAARAPCGGRHVTVPGTGHVVHDDAPAHYRHEVGSFLTQVLAATETSGQ